jgi:hypothetical protein
LLHLRVVGDRELFDHLGDHHPAQGHLHRTAALDHVDVVADQHLRHGGCGLDAPAVGRREVDRHRLAIGEMLLGVPGLRVQECGLSLLQVAVGVGQSHRRHEERPIGRRCLLLGTADASTTQLPPEAATDWGNNHEAWDNYNNIGGVGCSDRTGAGWLRR